MGKKLTQTKAEAKSLDVGVEMVGDYIDSQTKIEVKI